MTSASPDATRCATAAVIVVQGLDALNRRVRFSFDERSGLLLRALTLNPIRVGADPVALDYDDYRRIGPANVPFRIDTFTLDDSRRGLTQTFARVRDDEPVDDALFARPPSPPAASPSPRQARIERMNGYLLDWLNLLVRWVHVIAGIAWIGASFYFVWLDDSLAPPDAERRRDEGVGGELWAIHGGGFYHVQKYRVGRRASCRAHLHWFKWEAYSTWLSGFALLVVAVLRARARRYLIDRAVPTLTPARRSAISVGVARRRLARLRRSCAASLGASRTSAAVARDLSLFVAAPRWALLARVQRPRGLHPGRRDASARSWWPTCSS